MRKWIVGLMAVAAFALVGCESINREINDIESSFVGTERHICAYTGNGSVVLDVEGRFDIESTEYGNKVKFDKGDDRWILYNAVVVTKPLGDSC